MRFGRLNSIDRILIFAVLVAVAAGFGLRWLCLVPDPQVTRLEPTRLEAGRPMRVRVVGRDLRPFLRARVEIGRRDWPRALADDIDLDFSDWRTLFLPFLLESPEVAFVEVGALPPGRYNFALYDESREVVWMPEALTVDPPEAASQNHPARPLDVTVRFVTRPEVLALAREDVGVAVGATIVSLGSARSVDVVVRLEPFGDVVDQLVEATGVMRLAALQEESAEWKYNGRPVKAGAPFVLETSRYIMKGTIIGVVEQ